MQKNVFLHVLTCINISVLNVPFFIKRIPQNFVYRVILSIWSKTLFLFSIVFSKKKPLWTWAVIFVKHLLKMRICSYRHNKLSVNDFKYRRAIVLPTGYPGTPNISHSRVWYASGNDISRNSCQDHERLYNSGCHCYIPLWRGSYYPLPPDRRSIP
jgi:hypothetical protein